MTEFITPPAADLKARQEALDPTRSFIVQAPAGSGKTELLTQRLLALLSTVSDPEEILAITFTRKAAAEMRARLLTALQAAAVEPAPEAGHARQTWDLASKALIHSERQKWELLDNPSRLQLQTIDSFCSLLTRRMPWVSRFGAPPHISADPGELYRLASEQLLARLESGERGAESVALLLGHLDNQLSRLRDMIIGLLGRRDQWLRCLLDRRHEQAREQLEKGLQDFNRDLLRRMLATLGDDHKQCILEGARFAAENFAEGGDDDLLELLNNNDTCLEAELKLWTLLLELLLTGKDEFRKTVNVRLGFPSGPDGSEAKRKFIELLQCLAVEPGLLSAMRTFRCRPDAHYGENQWRVLDALIELLPLAVIELSQVFRQKGEIDFVEVSGAAIRALGAADAPEDLLLQLDARLSHILIDEFQDTSYIQYDLLCRMTAGWGPGDGRTLFLVGDPMQSIYRFRQAEVGYFLQVSRHGIGAIKPAPLRLEANFRSQQGIVAWVNQVFSHIFPAREDLLLGAVPYAPAAATRGGREGSPVSAFWFNGRQDHLEAVKVVDLIRQAMKEQPGGTIAVLVRARSHLEYIIPALKRAGIPYQAQDLDSLEQRPLIQDLRSLTRALLHTADRVSWLALLRAPWCGLSLEDLQRLIGGDKKTPLWLLLQKPQDQAELFSPLTRDGQLRWERIQPAITAALQRRGRVGLRRLVETTWIAIGGGACIAPSDLPDAERFFILLEELDDGGDLVDFEQLDRRLAQLFAAPDPLAGESLQLMTIHKAKGLQFDTVIMPGLGRTTVPLDRPLLNWIDHPDYQLLLAPVRRTDSSLEDPTYLAIQRLQQEKNDLETDRLLYVAVTRAIRRVYLLGHLETRANGDILPAGSSLLWRWWSQISGLSLQPPAEAEVDTPEVTLEQHLRRIPPGWVAPTWPESLTTRHDGFESASLKQGQDFGPLKLNLRSHEGRMTGNLVHQLLERYGQEGRQRPSLEQLRSRRDDWKHRLVTAGIPKHRLDDCCGRVLSALEQTFHGRHAAFLFDHVQQVETEFALHGTVNGRLLHAAIDRTFISAQGERWILDYKTSSPGPGEILDTFISREKSRYTDQLLAYGQLFRAFEPERSLRLALYFPLLDLLVKIEN